MPNARHFACALVCSGVSALPLLAACETIAGYDDAQPWPAEASAPFDAAGVPESAAPIEDHAVPIDAPIEASFPAETGVDSAPAQTRDASVCPVLAGGAICSQVPRFTAATQVVDGIGDEFCDVPATTYPVENAGYKKRAVAGTSFNEIATFRIAWSSDALHVHAHVVDPKIIVPTTSDLYSGDAVVIYFSGSSVLTGPFNATNDGGAMQILVSPASGTLPTRAYAFYWDPGARNAPVDPSLFASRLVPDGYEVELRLPWSPQKDPGSVTIGGSIGIDPGVIVKDDPASAGQDLEATLGFRPLPPNATMTCDSPFFAPWCDDRTWCVSALQ